MNHDLICNIFQEHNELYEAAESFPHSIFVTVWSDTRTALHQPLLQFPLQALPRNMLKRYAENYEHGVFEMRCK